MQQKQLLVLFVDFCKRMNKIGHPLLSEHKDEESGATCSVTNSATAVYISD